MNSSYDFDRDELLRLVDALCAETISAEDHARLEQILAESQQARQHYFDYVDLHLGLKQTAQDTPTTSCCPALPLELPDEPDRSPRGRATYWSYGAVAAAAFALSLAVQFFLPARSEPTAKAPPSPAPVAAKRYVATLGAMSECTWADSETAWSEGWRLMPGRLHLQTGVAEIRFDSGATVVIQGPTRIEIESAGAATLLEGQVVLHGDEVSEGFSLHTPDATLVDIGTEYAVSVEPNGRSEVHVFDGKVLRQSKTAEHAEQVEELNAGEAKRFSPDAARAARPVPLDAARFVRRVPAAARQDRNTKADLLVADRFEYDVAALPAESSGGAGIGWKKPWHGAREKPGLNLRPLTALDPTRQDRFGGGALWQTGNGEIGRTVQNPLSLNTDAVYYISFVIQRADDDERKFLQLRLHQGDKWDPERMFRMGIAHPGLAFLDLGTEAVRTSLPLEEDTPYLLVAKIVAGRNRPDQAFLMIYRIGQTIETEEPTSWTLNTAPVDCDGNLTECFFLFRGEGTQAVDELRIGRTWQSVTAAWQRD